MAQDKSNMIRVMIPRRILNHNAAVIAAVGALSQYVGGATRIESIGEWYDENNKLHFDLNYTLQWNFESSKFPRAEPLSRALVDALFAAGEKAVFKERNYNVNGKSRGYRARILYPEHNPIPDHIVLSGKMKLPDVLADDSSLRHLNS